MSTSESSGTLGEKNQSPIFRDLAADDDEVTEIESLCLQCLKNGITKLLMTKIPFYKEVVIMSFCCEHCGFANNELQPAAKIQEKGVVYRLQMMSQKDLARVVVKTEWASITIPELELEIPAQSQEGTVTTVEGVVERTCSGLESKVKSLSTEDPESATKLETFLNELRNLKAGNVPFTFIIRDCSGNSFLEDLCIPLPDPQLEKSYFSRSRDEDLMLGIYSENDTIEEEPVEENDEKTDFTDEVLGLPTNCYSCNAPCVTNMKVTEIPHFKDVVIMTTVCDVCGHKTNEVKSSSGIQPLGIRFSLLVQSPKDLSRDVLKSDTCKVLIKELELEVGSAAFGSRYSTVEGILTVIKDQLRESNPFIIGDSANLIMKERMENLLTKIDEVISSKRTVTLVLDDPCGNSYMQGIDYPDPDEALTVEKYERSLEEDEELGLLDMKVENYEES